MGKRLFQNFLIKSKYNNKTMKLKRVKACSDGRKLTVEEEMFYSSQGLPEKWARLDIYENGTHVNDFLLQSFEIAKEQAQIKFGVFDNDWIELESTTVEDF